MGLAVSDLLRKLAWMERGTRQADKHIIALAVVSHQVQLPLYLGSRLGMDGGVQQAAQLKPVCMA